jgi:hypothetical protein
MAEANTFKPNTKSDIATGNQLEDEDLMRTPLKASSTPQKNTLDAL